MRVVELRQHPKTYSKTTALLVFIQFISIEYTEQNGSVSTGICTQKKIKKILLYNIGYRTRKKLNEKVIFYQLFCGNLVKLH